MTKTWRIEDAETGSAPVGVPEQGLVSFHFLRTTLARRWRVWAATGLAGLVVAVAYALFIPAPSTGTVTLYLAHDPSTDPTTAMNTDVALLSTRSVASQLIGSLSLHMTPEQMQGQITSTIETPSILVLDVSGPTKGEAVARAQTLASDFLAFRSTQLRSQADAVVNGDTTRINDLQKQVSALTAEYDSALAAGNASSTAADTILTQRSSLSAQISALQQDIQQKTLNVSAVVTASHVVDPAALVPSSAKKRLALVSGSGVLGGLGVGIGWVLVAGLVSERLRRREEVAAALGIPVRFSLVRLNSRLPWRRDRVHDQLQAVAPPWPRRWRPRRPASAASASLRYRERQRPRGSSWPSLSSSPRGASRAVWWTSPMEVSSPAEGAAAR